MTKRIDHFLLEDIHWSHSQSDEIRSDRMPTPPKKTCIKKVVVTCLSCKHTWSSGPHGKGRFIKNFGSITLTCPSCSVEETIRVGDL